jgi:hypothetical protein
MKRIYLISSLVVILFSGLVNFSDSLNSIEDSSIESSSPENLELEVEPIERNRMSMSAEMRFFSRVVYRYSKAR